MAVHAHPDDESSKGAATMARYVHEGVEVLVVSCTGGERGDVLNPRSWTTSMTSPRDIAAVRRREMDGARRRSSGIQHAWLGFVDSGLAGGRPAAAAARGLLRARAARGGSRAAGRGWSASSARTS